MRSRLSFILSVSALFCAGFAHATSSEGVPNYYNQTPTYVGSQRPVQVVGQNTYSYQVPRQTLPSDIATATTANGIATGTNPPFVLSADYSRRFANFEFKTGVNSVLKWDDMIFNEVGVRFDSNFALKNFDLFAYGEYRAGTMGSGGFSIDYDLEPYDHSQKDVGIFTISVGDQSGKTNNIKFAFGAKNIWDIGGWKLSPSIGYEIFKHDLEMSNHYYPNPGIYLPLLTQNGDYVFGKEDGTYVAVAPGQRDEYAENGYFQVCLSPEDIAIGVVNSGSLTTGAYQQDPLNPYQPWGVLPGQCVIVGGDGPIVIEGTTHIYNTTWSGAFIGLEVAKQMTYKDSLRFYAQFGMPNYSSEGIWPNRTDWQQGPSFIDEGSTGAYSYQGEIEYNYQMSDRLALSLRADMNYFYVGKIGGKLYLAGYTDYEYADDGKSVIWREGGNGAICTPGSSGTCTPALVDVPAETVNVADSLKHAMWQSFALRLGLKYSF
ncbi:MAG: hypothetical protein LBL75_03605 [Rickettsiales bacterium]|jgi:hypothetical protein|nr:hypothetical protein [Rickettsiales bacterium]